jgi:acetyl-CoA carboxylase biotin carboxyl carrier protein
MNLEKVKKFIQLAKEEGVSSLKYEEKDLKISVEIGGNQVQAYAQPMVQPTLQNTQTNKENSASVSNDEGLHIVSSPFVGTFYSSPSPGAPEFVSVGKKVSKGDTLCILEAMKIMNEIEAEISGEIVEVCVDNESLVEFGQALFKIRA